MIKKIRKWSTTTPNGELCYGYHIYYDSGKRVHYSWKKNLPMTVVDFLLNAENCETEYIRQYYRLEDSIVKWETYT